MLVATWHILTTGEVYRDPGGDHFAKRDPRRKGRRLVAHVEKSRARRHARTGNVNGNERGR